MFPCKECLSKTRVKSTVCTYAATETIIKRRHTCKVCKHEFETVQHVPYKPTKEDSIRLARRVKAQLKAMDLTQAQFAERLNMPIDTVKAWFCDPGNVRFREIPAKRHEKLKDFCIDGYIFTKNRG